MTTYDLALSALFTALIVALGIVPGIPIAALPVPIHLQSLGVMLAGALLGPWRGTVSVLLLIALVMMGLPVLAGGRGGMGVLAGPTAGYLLGFIPAAFVTGLIVQRLVIPAGGPRWRLILGHAFACIVGGILIDHLCGVAWLVAVTGLPFVKAAWGTLLFVPGDLLKAAVAGTAAVAVRRVHPLEPK